MTILKSNLAVAFQEHSSATYSVVMYNMNTMSELFLENRLHGVKHYCTQTVWTTHQKRITWITSQG
jgi:hypothetical protein